MHPLDAMGSERPGTLRARTSACALAAVVALACTGCEEPVVAEAGSPAVDGGVQFEVGDYDVRYLEVAEGDEIFEYPRPVLMLPITLTNQGEGPITYNPTHSAPQMNEGSTPLLYQDPGPEADLPPAKKTPINGVILDEGRLRSQITKAKKLAPGDSLKDMYLFELPPKGVQSLILSLPPTWHRGTMPVLFRMSYTPRQPTGPKVYAKGEPISFHGVTFTVTGTETAYIKTEDTAQGEGYSTDPLYKISYEINNSSRESITYEPNHRAVAGTSGARLFSEAEGAHKRLQFGPTTTPADQVTGKKELAPGEEVSDYVLFEQPAEEVSELTFEYPASLFDARGIARVSLPYQHETPEKPEELQKEKKKDEDNKED